MTNETLDVFIASKRAGVLSQDNSGALSFQYLRGYRGVPLSSIMPLSTSTYHTKVVLPYLWGLLPEDPTARKRVALEAGISPNNPFALLSVIGLDCPGAVQFCQPESNAEYEEHLTPLSEIEIANRLSIGRKEGAGWLTENEHWSLGGQQNKFALRREDNKWFSCEGAAATTHILKSGVKGLSHQALNEFACMQLAAACDINVAKTEYIEFKGKNGPEPAIVIERYDRTISNGKVSRLHQEDFCQALGCLPENKYTMYGGPTCTDIIMKLKSTGPVTQANVANFLQMLFFNYLLAATDAHAKNYSFLLKPNGAHELAPMYDVASIAPYIDRSIWKTKPPKLAMSIGGENRVGRLSFSDLEKLVKQCNLEEMGINAEGCANLLLTYAKVIPLKLAEIFDNLSKTSSATAVKELRTRMEAPIIELCAKTLECLS